MNNVNPRLTEKQSATDSSQCKFTLDAMSKPDKSFGGWLAEQLEIAGIKQSQLAKLVGTSRQHISGLIRSAEHAQSGAPARPSIEMVDKIAAVTRLTCSAD